MIRAKRSKYNFDDGNSKHLQRYDFNKARLPEQSRDYQQNLSEGDKDRDRMCKEQKQNMQKHNVQETDI